MSLISFYRMMATSAAAKFFLRPRARKGHVSRTSGSPSPHQLFFSHAPKYRPTARLHDSRQAPNIIQADTPFLRGRPAILSALPRPPVFLRLPPYCWLTRMDRIWYRQFSSYELPPPLCGRKDYSNPLFTGGYHFWFKGLPSRDFFPVIISLSRVLICLPAIVECRQEYQPYVFQRLKDMIAQFP